MKTWLAYLFTPRSASASSTRNGFPVRQRASLARTWSASGLRCAGGLATCRLLRPNAGCEPPGATYSCSACCRRVPACASSFGEYAGATQTVGGPRLRKDEPTWRKVFGSENQIALQETNFAETGTAVEPPKTGTRQSLQIGQPSASWVNCKAPVAWPRRSSCENLDAWWPPTDRCPPGNCTVWPHPGSRCKPSPAQTVVA